jgi:tRNA pseudouridine38-40 synthase
MERNVKLVLAYEGTGFHGWQRQAGVRTVQGELEEVLRSLWGEPVELRGASRTDAGVHARGQVAAALMRASIPVENLARAIGDRLAADVALLHASEAARDFHPARDARGKLYRYRVCNAKCGPVADLAARFAWHVRYPLDLDRMRAAAAGFVGTHDFAGFESQGSPRQATVRTVWRVGLRRHGQDILCDVEGDGFLYNQVRNMIGTLVEIGRGRWPPERVSEILAAGDRQLAGPTTPAQGLCLQWVRYPPAVDAAHGSE